MAEPEDAAPKTPSAEPKTEPQEAPREIFGVPLAAFVKGGTSTSQNDRRIAEVEADAERRRDIAARERAIAKVPIEKGGGKIYSNSLTDKPEIAQAYVELTYLTPRGEDTGIKCLADVLVGAHPPHPAELTLVLVCPRCKARGVPQGQCQIRIHQCNKRWELDTRTAGELIMWEENGNLRPYRSAGKIMECERFECGYCGNWSARIDKNRVWPDA